MTAAFQSCPTFENRCPRRTRDRVLGRRDRPGGGPPQDAGRAIGGLEPLAATADQVDVPHLVDVLVQLLDRLPDRHVEEDQLIIENSNFSSVALVRLITPHKPRTFVSERVQRLQALNETGHDGIFNGPTHAGHICVCQMRCGHLIRRNHYSFRLRHRACVSQSHHVSRRETARQFSLRASRP